MSRARRITRVLAGLLCRSRALPGTTRRPILPLAQICAVVRNTRQYNVVYRRRRVLAAAFLCAQLTTDNACISSFFTGLLDEISYSAPFVGGLFGLFDLHIAVEKLLTGLDSW